MQAITKSEGQKLLSDNPVRRAWIIKYVLVRICSWSSIIMIFVVGFAMAGLSAFGEPLSIESFLLASLYIFCIMLVFLILNAIVRWRRFSFHLSPEGLQYSEAFISRVTLVISYHDIQSAQRSNSILERLLGVYDVDVTLDKNRFVTIKGIDAWVNISDKNRLTIPGLSLQDAAVVVEDLKKHLDQQS